MRALKGLALAAVTAALSTGLSWAGPPADYYGTGSVLALDNLPAQGNWTLQITHLPNQPSYFRADFSVDTNGDNQFTEQDAQYSMQAVPLNAIPSVSVRCGPPAFIQYSLRVNGSFTATLNGQPLIRDQHGVIHFRSNDQRSWSMFLAVDLDSKEGLELVTGHSFQFTPIFIGNPCP